MIKLTDLLNEDNNARIPTKGQFIAIRGLHKDGHVHYNGGVYRVGDTLKDSDLGKSIELFNKSKQRFVKAGERNIMSIEFLLKQMKKGSIKLKKGNPVVEVTDPLNEDYYNNTELYKKEFKKRGFKLKENYDDWTDWYYKDFPLGRYVVGFDNLESYSGKPRQDSNKRWKYTIFFNPFPKYKKKFFGMIKSKERNLGKQINYKEGVIDFGVGLFTVDDKSFLKKLFKSVDKYEKEAKKVSKIDYLSDKESSYTGHPVVEATTPKKIHSSYIERSGKLYSTKADGKKTYGDDIKTQFGITIPTRYDERALDKVVKELKHKVT